jgi:Holliday junction resolvase
MSKHFRGSPFMGVSKNGKSWQILVMVESEKIYLCSSKNLYEAATLYDLTIIQVKGMSGRTNFQWTCAQILASFFVTNLL